MRLIEPLGLLAGSEAEAALTAGLARPLWGGRWAFTLARLIPAAACGAAPVIPAAAIPPGWEEPLARLAAIPPPWAGFDWRRPLVMGILNVTPDSFSDAGLTADPTAAIAAGRRMADEGADIIDVGGESTRPGAGAVAPAVEQARVLPVVRALAAAGLRVSIDTRNAATMGAALDAGAAIVNDVSALAHDPAAAGLLARRRVPVVLMHMRGDPATMGAQANYHDVAADVARELGARLAAALAAGIARHRIVIDPGIGFAKTAEHNLELIRRLPLFLNHGCGILLGVSRKSFIGKISGESRAGERVAGSIALGLYSLARGTAILRVHDVAASVQALRALAAVEREDTRRASIATVRRAKA